MPNSLTDPLPATQRITLGNIDDQCARTLEHPVDVLETLLVARDSGPQFLATDSLEVIA